MEYSLKPSLKLLKTKLCTDWKMIIKMHSNLTFGDINTIIVLLPMSGKEQLSWQLSTKYNSMPQIGINVLWVEYSKQENSWLKDTLTQWSNIVQTLWLHIMISKHGRMSMQNTDKKILITGKVKKNEMKWWKSNFKNHVAETVQRPVWFP